MSDTKSKKIYLAGHQGMVGSAILRELASRGYANIVTRTRSELDLLDQTAVREFIKIEQPHQVIIAAAKVGGIYANNTYPAEFIYENLMIECNLIHSAFLANCKNLLFLGSSCIYPKLAKQPMEEGELLTGPLEPTNEPYAIAKIAGIKLCESYNRQYGTDYRSVMPTNLYGPGDNFHPENSHVIPALMRRIHEAKIARDEKVIVWGSGNAKREFMHVQDMADACVHVTELSKEKYESLTDSMVSQINLGVGVDVTIRDLAELLKKVIGYEGEIVFDTSKPDGPPRKLLDVGTLAKSGWKASIGLNNGLLETYNWLIKEKSLRL